MKTNSSKFCAKTLATVAIAMLGAPTFAASTWTKDLQVDCSVNAQSQSCLTPPAVTISAWTTGTGTTAAPTVGTTFSSSALVYNWGTAGLGIVSNNEVSSVAGPHAIDNGYGIEAMMVNFTTGPVNLSSLTIGWNGTDNPTTNDNNGTAAGGGTPAINYNDSDLSVLAWTGGAGGPTMAGSSLLSVGWTLIGNYANVGSIALPANTQSPITSTIYSSYWLISAYSSAYFSGSAAQETAAGLSQGNDAFKVLSIAGNTCGGSVTNNACGSTKVPEPGSLTLLGLGLVGMLAARRRKQASM